jgi:hypothetical protein
MIIGSFLIATCLNSSPMTTRIIAQNEIRAQILKVLSGYCFRERVPHNPRICILSPWMSDVELQIDKAVFALDETWFGLDYGIASINLSYALLLLRLDFGATIEIITLPPNEQNYGNSALFHQRLLEFLDEIGCNVYLNESLHSKLILSNDSALIGSFNLSKSALYEREEIGITLDDIGNLTVLDEYANRIIHSSVPYGYTANAHMRTKLLDAPLPSRITRGVLYENLVWIYYGHSDLEPFEYGEFLRDEVDIEGIYSKYIVTRIASDLEGFYVKALLAYLQPPTAMSLNEDSIEKKLRKLHSILGYTGKFDLEEMTNFINARFGRQHFPRMALKMKSMPKVDDEVTPSWAGNS